MPSWSKPLCLVESGSGHTLHVNETTAAKLGELSGPVVIVGIAGLWRTGKSYLMNLLAGSTKGFSLGSKITAETKGIWAWVVDHPTKPGTNLVLIDTEGLGDTSKGDRNHDTWIFSLTVLLSSTLVYNSKGTIDNDALEKLHFVTEIADHIKMKNTVSEDKDDFDKYFPGFVWCVRDFSLDLEIDGKEITSDQYLETALKLKKGNDQKTKDFNLPRQCIRRFFPTRACFTFPTPVGSRKLMKDLENLPNDKLEEEFVQVAGEFRKYIYSKAKPKTFNGREISGSMLAGLLKEYVDAIKKGTVPCIENAVKVTSQVENEKARVSSITHYKSSMSRRINLPTETQQELSAVHLQCEKEAITLFLKAAIFDDDHAFQQKLAGRIQEEFQKICDHNEASSYEKCADILKKLCKSLDENVHSEKYAVPGGYHTYMEDRRKVEDEFQATPGKGMKSAEALQQFIKERQLEASSILAADKKITEAEKKICEEQLRVEFAEKQRAAAEAETARIEQRAADQQKSNEENVQQIRNKMEKDLAAQREDHNRIMESRLTEQEKLLKEGFKKQAKKLQDDVQRLKQKLAEAEQRIRNQPGLLKSIFYRL